MEKKQTEKNEPVMALDLAILADTFGAIILSASQRIGPSGIHISSPEELVAWARRARLHATELERESVRRWADGEATQEDS